MNDLEAATVAELIAELLRRTTFRGVIAWQAESFKGAHDADWQWRSSNCNPALSFQELAEKIKPCQLSQYEILGQATHDLANLRNEYRTLLDLLRQVCDGSIDRDRVQVNMDGAGSWALLAEQTKQAAINPFGPRGKWTGKEFILSPGPLTPADVEPQPTNAGSPLG